GLLVWIEGEHFHSKSEREVDHPPSDLAGADDTERLVFKLKSAPACERKVALLFCLGRFDQASRQSEHEGKRMLGDGVGIAAGSLADDDAASRAFADIDMIVARRARRDQLERRMRIQERCVNLRLDENA